MPTYVYKREDGSTFEINQRMSADALTECPTTGQKVKRVISGGSGVVYKGEGWYVTDYKDRGKPKEKAENSAAGSEASGGGTTEAKPEAKKESTKTESKTDAS